MSKGGEWNGFSIRAESGLPAALHSIQWQSCAKIYNRSFVAFLTNTKEILLQVYKAIKISL